MGNNNNANATGGVGFLSLLQIAFIVLKLCGVIKWSWFCVFLPTIIPVLLVFIIAALIYGPKQ